jgi:hypothetical protein
MGVAAVDIENDGDLDLFMTHLGNESNTLYVNHDGYFDDSTASFGLAAPSIQFTGFGLGFADFDNDGNLDLFVANGRVGRSMTPTVDGDNDYAEPNQLFQGNGNSHFVERLPRGGTREVLIDNSRAALFGDYDNDGDIDVVVVNNNGQARLLSNQVGSSRNWIRFRVRDKHGHDAYGARVRLQTGNVVQWRIVSRAYSYQSSNEPFAHFGLGARDKAEKVTVFWPSGVSEEFGARPSNQVSELRAGEGSTVEQLSQLFRSRAAPAIQ